MAKLDTLLTRVLDEFPAVAQTVALRALSDATKEFCTRSGAWQDSLDPIAIVAGQDTYDVSLDTGLQLVALVDVRVDGKKVYPVATELARLRDNTPGNGSPRGYVQWGPSTIELIRPPADAAQLTVKAALTLALGNTSVDVTDSVLDEYGEYIACGAKARLVRQSNQPWYAPDAVTGYAGPFYDAINNAKRRANTALGSAEVQVQMREW
ncbi:phage adaptor protein [Candidimonas nitroreducens]|uniref:Uncharacterized protein n=1 Tax=Candidimonas nitroreducens TaxID=683354 RepID=A0A225M1S3_9BURK|nr:hypothetical protein [Candidimonas nitroreducens]OWT55268.1 hypothetical protein CEY11_21400 [Candidimonas nitroreducens]